MYHLRDKFRDKKSHLRDKYISAQQIIISKKIAGFDVRQKGSGNAGTTNMLRSVGKGVLETTLLLCIINIKIFYMLFKINNIFFKNWHVLA